LCKFLSFFFKMGNESTLKEGDENLLWKQPIYLELELCGMAYLKKSSLQKSWPFLRKHVVVRLPSQSAHFRHRECQVCSTTFNMNRSRIIPSQPAQRGIVAGNKEKIKFCLELLSEPIQWWFLHLHGMKNTRIGELKGRKPRGSERAAFFLFLLFHGSPFLNLTFDLT